MSTTPTPANLPERAENIANQTLHGVAALRHAASELEAKAQHLYALVTDITSANLIPHGFDVEDIPGYPGIQVIYHPSNSDEYHAIVVRGVDISEAVSTEVELAAIKVVEDAYAARTNPPAFDFRKGE
jgi:hypothetical protein